MIVPDSRTLELNVPEDPQWWTNNSYRELRTVDLGQFKVTIYKSPDRVLHVRAIADIERKKVEATFQLGPPPERFPVELFIQWNPEILHLRLAEQPPTEHPWQVLPEPPPR